MGRRTSAIVELFKQGHIPESTLRKMSDFKDELEKTAGGSPWVAAAITAALGLGFAGGQHLIGKYQEEEAGKELAASKVPAFRRMMSMHPILQTEDRTLVKTYFDSLWHFAPNVAQDPLAAGGHVRQAMQFHDQGGPGISAVKDLADTEKKFLDARRPSYDPFKSQADISGEVFKKVIPGLSYRDYHD